MKKPIEQRRQIIMALISGGIDVIKATQLLGRSRRTIERQRKAFLDKGEEGLIDHRHSNYHRLSEEQRQKAAGLKRKDRWRSARNIRDNLRLPVHETTVWRLLHHEGLTRENIERVKPIERFEARYPNEMWQTDIMGKIVFPNLGPCYLIAALDDHSRFCLSGRWFKTQGKMNVFQIWYEALARWGKPESMLQDEGSQYKARTRFGSADYEWYADALGIKLIWARKAQTKGKIERFWRFVQGDFVHEVWKARTLDELNRSSHVWLARYNYLFKSRYFGNETRVFRYHSSERRVGRTELQTLLVIEERRKVTRESTVSLYGKHYYVPNGYIGCRIWLKIIGNKVHFEANGETFWKTRLKLS